MPTTDDDTKKGSGTSGDALTIPDDVQKNHKEVLDLILGSESMNNSERQYWIDILPIMTPDQKEQLMSILTNEREQLAAIDAKYGKKLEQEGHTASLQKMEAEREKKLRERSAKEAEVRAQEHAAAEDILKDIE